MAAWGRMPRLVLALDALFALAAAATIVVLWRRRADLRAVARRRGPLRVRDRRRRRRALDEPERRRRLRLAAPLGAADGGVPGARLRPQQARRVGLRRSRSRCSPSRRPSSRSRISVGTRRARRRLGLLAAAFWTAWPLLVGLIAGHHAWTNGQWEVDVGLHNYSEPLSTLLVTAGAALLLSPQLTELRLALAGCALSAATLVKLSNALLAAAALLVVFLRGRTREALPVSRRRARARAARRRRTGRSRIRSSSTTLSRGRATRSTLRTS